MTTARAALLVLLAVAAVGSPAAAQGGSTDILVGRVVGPDSVPIRGARVEATSVETGVTRAKTTDAQGRYTILFMDGGGQYRVIVRMLGFSPQSHVVTRQADEDRLVQDFALSTIASTLDAVVVTARQAPRAGERPEPGSTERLLSGEQLARLPIDATDPNIIALLQPGVIGVAGSDSTAAGFSVAGQRTDQNLVTLDGLTFGTGTVPQEAVRSTRVITNTYDVARGQFTGGQVATTTRSGTNQTAGTFTYSLRDPHLELDGGDNSQALGAGFTQHTLSGGLGGALKRDRAFVFGSFQVRRRIDPLQTLTSIDATTMERLGLSPDSAARFSGIVNTLGVPLTVAAVPSERLSDNGTLIGRFDWHVNQDHSLMFRGNWQGNLQSAFRANALAFPSHAGKQEGDGAGGMLTLTSVLGTFLNEGRVYYGNDGRTTAPYLATPEGRVRVTSDLDVSSGVTTLEFGGNGAMPTEGINDQLELTDELSWIPGAGGHRLRLGGLLNYTGFSSETQQNNRGSFTFNSLAELAANQPAEFRRSLQPTDRSGGSWNAAAYLGDTWRKSRALQLTYGVRIEGSSYDGRPAYNPAVDAAFGRRTDFFPRDVRVSPRAGFTWQIGLDTARGGPAALAGRPNRGAGGGGGGGRGGLGGLRGGLAGQGGANGPGVPTLILRGGVGEFRGRAPTQLFQSAIDATGLAGAEQQLVCVGASVPVPDWDLYLADPSTIPTQCSGPPAPTTSGQRPTVTVFDPEFATPRSIRSSLGATRRIGARYGLSLDYTFARGTSLYGLRDLNLEPTPDFTLALEGSRPVFAPASSVVPATGVVSVFASRRDAAFAQVIEASSRLHSNTHQLTASFNAVSLRNMIWSVSYTAMRSRDQTGFAAASLGGGGAGGRFGGGALGGAGGGFGTVGVEDPNGFSWGTSDLERRHSVLGNLTWLARPWLDLTGILRLSSGQPYTPRVGGDVNGDGARNDRAFVFDPASTAIGGDTALVNGMQRLLAGAPGAVRECLASQLGQIAERNSCRGDWTSSLDLQANLRPRLPGLDRRLTFVVTAINPLAGLDQLFHGSNGLHGWGQPNRPDQTLLYVRGFDAAQQRFIYQVNERFGDNTRLRTAFRSPFMLGVQARLQVGPDRQRELLQERLGALNNRGRAAGGGFDFAAILDRISPNPSRLIIDLKDSLKLTPQQIVRLQLIGDSLESKSAMLEDSLEARVASAPPPGAAPAGAPAQAGVQPGQPAPRGELQAVFQRVQPLLQQARANYLAAVKSIEEILTPEQWAQLPENFRNPTLQRPGLGRPGRRPPPAH